MAPLYPWRRPHGPVKGPPTRLASGRRPQLPARPRDAGLEPAGRRPRRPGLPRRALPARRPGDLERQLVRRPLHAHLQLPLPAARLAARGRSWSGRSRSSPPPTSSIASSATAGASPPAGRRSGSPPAWSPCSPTASSPSPSASPSAWPRCAACSSAATSWPSAAAAACALSSPVAAAFLAGVVLVGRAGAGPAGQPARRRAGGDRPRPRPRAQPRLPRIGPVPLRLLLLRRDPALVRLARSSSPAGWARRSASCAGRWPATCSAATLLLLAPEPDRRQRGAPRRALRRPGAGRGDAGPAAAPRRLLGPRPLAGDGRRPLLAGDRERQPDRPQRRRPLDLARATSSPPPSGCARTAARGVRVEVPPTANHWESAYLATQFELARGWLRQLDTTRDDIFYGDDSQLTVGRLPALAAPATRSPTSPCPTPRSTTPRSPSGA